MTFSISRQWMRFLGNQSANREANTKVAIKADIKLRDGRTERTIYVIFI